MTAPPAITRRSIDRKTEIADSIFDLVGDTPMVRLGSTLNDTKANIILKLESQNPLASVKDRLGMGIYMKAEKEGLITPGKSIIVEATSGNTGIALAHQGALRGYKVIITMPETMSMERRALLKIFGAEVILTPGSMGMKGAIAKAKLIVANTPDSILAEQFSTKYNAEIHYETTGPEVWAQTAQKIDYFVAGVGTGGTITGTAKYLKEQSSAVKAVAVEPEESPVLSGGKPGPHKIQGLGAGFVPDVVDRNLIDEVITCPSSEAIAMAQRLPTSDGVFCGFSGGANVYAALKLARRPEMEGKTIVVVIPSFGERYLSTALFQNIYDEASKLPVTPASELTV